MRPMSGFSPLRRAPRAKLAAAAVVGPVIWLVALALVAVLIKRADLIEFGLLVAAVSFVLAILCLAPARIARGRRDRRDAP